MLSKSGGDYLVITKSLKDCMCLYEYGIPAIAPNSENLFITDKQYQKLKQKYRKIFLFYDNDLPHPPCRGGGQPVSPSSRLVRLAGDGKRFSAGITREYSSTQTSANGRYSLLIAFGSYHWISTTMVSQPYCFKFFAINYVVGILIYVYIQRENVLNFFL